MSESIDLITPDPATGLRYYEEIVLGWAGDSRFEHLLSSFTKQLYDLAGVCDRENLVRLHLAFPLAMKAWARWKRGELK